MSTEHESQQMPDGAKLLSERVEDMVDHLMDSTGATYSEAHSAALLRLGITEADLESQPSAPSMTKEEAIAQIHATASEAGERWRAAEYGTTPEEAARVQKAMDRAAELRRGSRA